MNAEPGAWQLSPLPGVHIVSLQMNKQNTRVRNDALWQALSDSREYLYMLHTADVQKTIFQAYVGLAPKITTLTH